MVQRHKERCFWEDRIEPPRRYFDNQPLGKVLLKDLAKNKVQKECERTNYANSTWFNGLVTTGQFYNPLTKKRNIEAPNETKQFSMVSSSDATLDQDTRNQAQDNSQVTKKENASNFVNVAHMIYDYKQVKGGESKKHQMKASLKQALFNRETDFE